MRLVPSHACASLAACTRSEALETMARVSAKRGDNVRIFFPCAVTLSFTLCGVDSVTASLGDRPAGFECVCVCVCGCGWV